MKSPLTGQCLKLTVCSVLLAIPAYSLQGFNYDQALARIPLGQQNCETTQIYQPGYGWIPGSEITTCEVGIPNSSDGSEYLANLNASCGSGPCEGAPQDGDEDAELDPEVCEVEQAMESERDRLANEIADEIKSLGDWDQVEYGAVIYWDGSSFSRDALDRGTIDNVDFTISTSIGDVVALVHSHTPGSYSIPSPGDWSSIDTIIDAGYADNSTIAHYILNHDDGQFYEYDNTDRPRGDGLGFGTATHSDDAKGECND